MYSNFSMAYTPPIQSIVSSKQASNTSKTESVKNRTVCRDLFKIYTSITQKILKNWATWEIYMPILCKNFRFF